MLQEGCSVFIKAKCQKKYETSNFIDFHIDDVQYLSAVKQKDIERLIITIDASAVNDTIVSDLATLLKDSPGNTALFIQLHQVGEGVPVMLRSKSVGVKVNGEMLNFIEQCEGMSYHIN